MLAVIDYRLAGLPYPFMRPPTADTVYDAVRAELVDRRHQARQCMNVIRSTKNRRITSIMAKRMTRANRQIASCVAFLHGE